MKLTFKDRAEIRRLQEVYSQRELAAIFGVTQGTIRYALKPESGGYAEGRRPGAAKKRKAAARVKKAAWYRANADKVSKQTQRRRANQSIAEADRARVRAWHRRQRGTPNATGERKQGACEACGVEANLNFDHCHETGRHRGWLCLHCNMALGYVKDRPERLQALIAYLERSKL